MGSHDSLGSAVVADLFVSDRVRPGSQSTQPNHSNERARIEPLA
jgi:hypothetical protein